MIERRPCAKINLALAVLGRRPDGFHDIRSWVVKLNWAERLNMKSSTGLSLTVDSEDPSVPQDSGNLVWRAAEKLAAAAGRSPEVTIHLHKSLPSGAGLGGGSSDAAETLLGLNDLWQLVWSRDRLAAVGAELGCDVPLFMMEGPVLMAGRGEVLSRLALTWQGWAVIVVPNFGLSTAAVYRAWSTLPHADRELAGHGIESARSARELLPMLFNDLETPAFSIQPRLQELHGLLDGLDGRPVRMTGSGSALFTLFDVETEANAWQTVAARRMPPDTKFHIVSVK